jgi:CHASE3 domain sensor protein
MLRKAAWLVAAPVLFAIVIANVLLGTNSLKQARDAVAQERQAEATQATISNVLQDFTDMESGQRGYLLTDDPAYLQPYSLAKARLANDFAQLRSALTNYGDKEKSLETRLETLASSKEAEMDRTIDLRERGFRLRAFRIIDTNEGKEYMDQARTAIVALSATQRSSFASLQRIASDSLRRTFTVIILGNLCLLAVGALLFAVLRHDRKTLLQEAGEMKHALGTRESQLQKLTLALSDQTYSNLNSIGEQADLLLQKYGGFLPREGYQCAEQIKEAAAQMEQLRRELLWQPASAA